jgi:glycosyltransferase involved in cell wall biosynthesis
LLFIKKEGKTMIKILVRGPALSSSGYGEQCRYALRALKAHEIKFDIYLENIQWGKTGWIHEDNEFRAWLDFLIGKTVIHRQNGGQFDVSLQVTIPNEWQKLAPINIGYTAGIETTKVAPEWLVKANEMDKIIVVSNHAKYGFENTVYNLVNQQTNQQIQLKLEKQIDVVNYYPRDDVELKEIELDLKTDFNFLSVAQWGPRKNVEATLNGFLEEFKDEENVGLVLKISTVRHNTSDKMLCEKRLQQVLLNHPNAKCKVYLLHGNIADNEMRGLYTHPKIKAMVSTTHGEGAGLPLLEAAAEGLPILAPAWSGLVDFLYMPVKEKDGKEKKKSHFIKIDYDLGNVQKEAVWQGVIQPDSMWCFVKNSSVRHSMREIYKNYGPHLSKAKKLQEYVKETFTKEKFDREFVEGMGIVDKDDNNLSDWLKKLNEGVTEYE